jgi:benzoyl-CoA reductase/2-hydroxyglutaryl-CoA dehydratase subunit BcrC/BadD/HgdB
MVAPNWRVPYLVEICGGVIVAEESCVGERSSRCFVCEEGQTRQEIMDRIAERYLSIDCAVFAPNDDRLDDVSEMASRYNVQGVIHYEIPHCTPYQIEFPKVARTVRQRGLPLLCLRTEYGMGDSVHLQDRIEAFLQQLG